MVDVSFNGVSKIYPDGTRAVSDVSLDIPSGELLVLVGPSGCGKSTLIRMLAGLETVTSGTLTIGGKNVTHLPPQQRNTAMVFQNYALYPHMTARQNLAFPLGMQRQDKAAIEAQIAETSRLLDLGDLLDKKPVQLSGGQRQRVAMGRAIVRKPSVFLMDEPLSNLDAKLRAQIRTDIAALQRTLGTTTLYVTHDQVEAMTLGQRVCVLKDGAVQQLAAPKAIYDAPANVFTAAFFGSPGMNIVPGRVRQTGADAVALDLDDQSVELRAEADPPVELKDTPYLIGFRPETLQPVSSQSPHGLTLDVTAVERLGHEQLVYGRLTGTAETKADLQRRLTAVGARPGTVAARLGAGAASVETGPATFGFSSGAIHLFVAEYPHHRLATLSLRHPRNASP